MHLRTEAPGDVDDVRTIHLAAFNRPELDGRPAVEAGLLDALREGGHLLPELTIVAVEEERLVGHVAASRASVSGEPVVALGPIGVLPERQGRGAGRALVEAVLAAADTAGERAVVLLGDPALYGRFGFVDSRDHDIIAPDPLWGRYFQVRPLRAWSAAGPGHPLSGTAAYAPPFDAL